MKRYIILFTLHLLVSSLHAQTYTFNMHDTNNTKYRVYIKTDASRFTLKNERNEIETEYFEGFTIERKRMRIGLSLETELNPVTISHM